MKFFQTGLLLVISFCYLTGCAGLLIGGAVEGCYYAERENNKRSPGEIMEDAAIASSVKAKFLGDDQVSALKVNVVSCRGVVTLEGLVPNQAAATRAIELALATDNVTRVVSHITMRDQALSPRGVVYE